MNLPMLVPAAPTCIRCPLYLGARTPGVPSEHLSISLTPTPTTPALICLGMNPGFEEDSANRPFIGRSGRILKESFLLPLLPHFSIYLMNSIRCYTPTDTKIPPVSLTSCFNTHLISDLRSVLSFHSSAPTYLLCLGAVAVASLHKNCPNSVPPRNLKAAFSHQGWPLTLPFHLAPSYSVFTTYHPAAVLRSPALIHPVSDHLSLLLSHFLTGAPPAPSPSLIPPRAPLQG